jgi:hypothetical protein
MNTELYTSKLKKNDVFSGWDDIGNNNPFHLGSKLIEKNSNTIVRGDYVNYDSNGKEVVNLNTFEDQEINKYQSMVEKFFPEGAEIGRNFDEERKKFGRKSQQGQRLTRKNKQVGRGSLGSKGGKRHRLTDDLLGTEIQSEKVSPEKLNRPANQELLEFCGENAASLNFSNTKLDAN